MNCVAFDDDHCVLSGASAIDAFPIQSGLRYYILISGWDDSMRGYYEIIANYPNISSTSTPSMTPSLSTSTSDTPTTPK